MKIMFFKKGMILLVLLIISMFFVLIGISGIKVNTNLMIIIVMIDITVIFGIGFSLYGICILLIGNLVKTSDNYN